MINKPSALLQTIVVMIIPKNLVGVASKIGFITLHAHYCSIFGVVPLRRVVLQPSSRSRWHWCQARLTFGVVVGSARSRYCRVACPWLSPQKRGGLLPTKLWQEWVPSCLVTCPSNSVFPPPILLPHSDPLLDLSGLLCCIYSPLLKILG